MEWLDLECSQESLFALLSTPLQKERTEWSFEDNKIFENALAEIQPNSPGFFEYIGLKIPWKSIPDIKRHYEALVQDLKMIENGQVPIPNYQAQEKQEQSMEDDVGGSEATKSTSTTVRNQRKRALPWTEEEHQLFLLGLNKYGKGDWRNISRHCVLTKNPTQVASHAQKYFRRQTCSTPFVKRRPSINDIHTVNPLIFDSLAQRDGNIITNVEEPAAAIPLASPPGDRIPLPNQNYNNDTIEQNRF